MSRKDQLIDVLLIEKDGINKFDVSVSIFNFTAFTVKKNVSVTVEI